MPTVQQLREAQGQGASTREKIRDLQVHLAKIYPPEKVRDAVERLGKAVVSGMDQAVRRNEAVRINEAPFRLPLVHRGPTVEIPQIDESGLEQGSEFHAIVDILERMATDQLKMGGDQRTRDRKTMRLSYIFLAIAGASLVVSIVNLVLILTT